VNVTRNGDGTVTVRIPRGPEHYDAPSGLLESRETLTTKEYEAAIADADKPKKAKKT
jgi:hypothetical protein